MQATQVQLSESELRQEFSFEESRRRVARKVEAFGREFQASIPNTSRHTDPAAAYFHSTLDAEGMDVPAGARTINYIDLFCGGGGLSLGVKSALGLLGMKSRLALAADMDETALAIVRERFRALCTRDRSVEELVEYSVDLSGEYADFVHPPEVLDAEVAAYKNRIDLLIGGPPCQGHSNLNNKTRRADPRNLLYFVMPAFAVALNIPNILIENVPSIRNAKENVVDITRSILRTHGYHVEEVILDASEFGVAQTRRRHFLLASRSPLNHVHGCVESMKVRSLSFDDINSGLKKRSFLNEIMETNGVLSEENVARINYLHETGEFDLKNELRPDCHKVSHTYPSVYGRIYGDRPAQTITTGFSSPGRGRFIHPTERRTITVREAARIQAFPDWYWNLETVRSLNRAQITKIVGDAVPSSIVDPLIVSLFPGFSKA
ncbi:DNA cytosine methyltransferase [Vannielia litorea]|uniref:DNA cytosine methyltransferase n=1 Tax=Vannielia litorea TaxID=1217970 RepID=UPI001C9801C0|nr:DNA cytosine methyltransferase [Vannielia litorea]MBY6151660.1 DNA cytosine methyltransferase [Vannielia litorea]